MMCATECPSTRQLRDLTLGRLPNDESDDLLAHVGSCEACQTEIETIDDQEDSLIVSLRAPGQLERFQNEPECDLALAKSLGALAETAESNPDLILPQQIGEYEILRPLGRGGMGTVFLARHINLGRDVALKVLAHHRLGDVRVRERFETEMRAIGRLSHPNIVTAYDAREIDGTAVLVTEHIDGCNLGQLVGRTGPLSIADACEIARQIAVALEYTSGQGFVHRDVKPSNIMLSREGEVKLLDLGLARLQLGDAERPDMTGTGQAMGTADFIAPEQVTDSRSVDVRADIYSLGCTLFKLLTGSAPFSGAPHTTAFAKMTAHVSTPAPSLKTLRIDAPHKLVALVDAMLAKEAGSRPQSPLEVVDRLSEFTPGHDLPQLGRKADSSESDSPIRTKGGLAPQHELTSTAKQNSDAVRSHGAQPKSFLNRTVPLSWLIATGFAAGLLGFALGIIVKITYPDGTAVSLKVPEGGQVEMSPTGAETDTAPDTNGVPSPAEADADQQAWSVLNRLQGTWQVLEALDSGRPGDVSGLHMSFRGNQFLFHSVPGDNQSRGDGVVTISESFWGGIDGYELDLIDLKNDGNRKEAILHFIDEDRIQICLNEGKGGRPKRFDSEPDSVNDVLITLARVKPADPTIWQQSQDNSAQGNVKQMPDTRQLARDPLWFGVLKDEAWYTQLETSGDDLTNARGEGSYTDRKNPNTGQLVGDRPFHSRDAIWCRVSDDISMPPNMRINFGGENTPWFTALERDAEAVVPWSEVYRDIMVQTRIGGQLEFGFQGKLEERMQRIAESHMNGRLAIVLNGKIIAAPKIVSPLIRRARVTGLSREDGEFLMQSLTGLVAPPLQREVESVNAKEDRRESAIVRLKQFLLALNNYEAVYRQFPASRNNSLPNSVKETEPYSWRVAILPFIEEAALYDLYRFDEPWDSEHNLTLLDQMPKIFRSPLASDDQNPGHTNYQGFAGDQTAMGKDQAVKVEDIVDGTANTLLVVETKTSVPWTKPDDLSFERPSDAKHAIPFPGEPLRYATADGSVLAISSTEWEELAKQITRSGGEPVRHQD